MKAFLKPIKTAKLNEELRFESALGAVASAVESRNSITASILLAGADREFRTMRGNREYIGESFIKCAKAKIEQQRQQKAA